MRYTLVLLTLLTLPALLVSIASAAAPTSRPVAEIEPRCRALLAEWQERFDAAQFNALVAPPFVIAGDAELAKLTVYRDRTILAATTALQRVYFDKQPAEPVLILLFESAEPYQRLAKKWFGNDDVPHYGYFRSDNIMLMNVGTGTGTLVHELTHVLIRPDFPDVPDWFNEGLASLYEQCTLADGAIRGLANWRLAGLQEAIRADTLRPLDEMVADPRFRDDQRVGINYAHARHLLMYLQERGLLSDYYAAFRDNAAGDPTGLETLKRTLKVKDLSEIEPEWRRWVLSLRFPE